MPDDHLHDEREAVVQGAHEGRVDHLEYHYDYNMIVIIIMIIIISIIIITNMLLFV